MDIRQAPEQLVHVELDKTYRNSLFGFAVVARNFVDRLRDELEDQVEKHLVFLLMTYFTRLVLLPLFVIIIKRVLIKVHFSLS